MVEKGQNGSKMIFNFKDTAGYKLSELEQKNKDFFRKVSGSEIRKIEKEIQEEWEKMTPEEREAEEKHTQEQYEKLVQRLKDEGVWREDE